jgi:hypothetical protein
MNLKTLAIDFATVGLLCSGLAACGPQAELAPQQAAADQALHHGSAACEELFAQLEAAREELAVTDEWKALETTAAYSKFVDSLRALGKASCRPFEKDPSATCAQLKHSMGTAWDAVRDTEAYRKSEVTPQYQAVRSAYRAVREHACWPGQEHSEAPTTEMALLAK